MLQDIIFTNPIPLLEIEDKSIRESIDNFLPFSSAFETECYDDSFVKDLFLAIPDIMDVSGGYGESRFRIPSGLKGLVCLYKISLELKRQCKLNKGSGNHYHVDCTDVWSFIKREHVEANEEWLLQELESWHYKGTYNKKGICGFINTGAWLRFNSLCTMEFRIGEMTFDYPLLAKRIIHANQLARRFKIAILENNTNSKLKDLYSKLKSYKQEDEDRLLENNNFGDLGKEVIKSRIVKI